MVKIDRCPIEPRSLAVEKIKKSGRYNLEDVVSQLYQDGSGKCYICEIKMQDMNVEHLRPHEGKDRDLMFDWNNLFLACPHCNNVKNKDKYKGRIIDCCQEDPEELFDFQIRDQKVQLDIKKDDRTEAVYTAQLIEEVFNSGDPAIRKYQAEVRMKKLLKEMQGCMRAMMGYFKHPEQKIYHEQLRIFLSRSSEFAAFKRTFARKYTANYPQLEQFIDG